MSADAVVRRRLRQLLDGPSLGSPTTTSWWDSLALPFGPPSNRMAAAVALSAASLAWAVGGPVAVLAGIAVVVSAGVATSRSAPSRWAAAADRELPDVLEQVARQLRAGGSLAQAIAGAEPSATALAEPWLRLRALIPVVGVGAALDDWADGNRPAVQLAAAALAMAAESGGSPARALDGVAATLRVRQSVVDEARSLSSQARASAIVIALAPLAFGAFAAAADARTAAFLRSPAGVSFVVGGLSLDGLGAWWMARLCRSASA